MNINKMSKKINLAKIDKIIKECEVVNLFGDMSLCPFNYIKNTPNYDSSKWPECNSSRLSSQGVLLDHMFRFRYVLEDSGIIGVNILAGTVLDDLYIRFPWRRSYIIVIGDILGRVSLLRYGILDQYKTGRSVSIGHYLSSALDGMI